jgi:D-arabinose 1-dehydrogenase-like Zn-dependent alcohol dehydrogenase
MGTIGELAAVCRLLAETGVRPLVDSEVPLDQARTALERLHSGEEFGKVVLTHA